MFTILYLLLLISAMQHSLSSVYSHYQTSLFDRRCINLHVVYTGSVVNYANHRTTQPLQQLTHFSSHGQ